MGLSQTSCDTSKTLHVYMSLAHFDMALAYREGVFDDGWMKLCCEYDTTPASAGHETFFLYIQIKLNEDKFKPLCPFRV